MLTLPTGEQITSREVRVTVEEYAAQFPCVFDLFDFPNGGPHDEVLAVDLLALNALNAWGSGQPMTAMTNAWLARDEIKEVIIPISNQPLEEMSQADVVSQVDKVGIALDTIDAIKGFGNTATAKFFHRLRPNLGPIWDKWIGGWYEDCPTWSGWVAKVYAHVREPETCRCLIEARTHIKRPLSLLRVWDIILWQRAAQSLTKMSSPVID